MSYQSFEQKWLGQHVDTDGFPADIKNANGTITVKRFQCVDLVKQYMHDEYGVPFGSYGDAANYGQKPHPEILRKFDPLLASTPVKAGDLLPLYGLNGKTAGHIGIATGSQNNAAAEILEQNGSTGNGDGEGPNRIRKRFVPKSRIICVLRPKTVVVASAPQSAPAPPAAPGQRTYTVVKGDNLTKIAKKFGYITWHPLYEKNRGVIGNNPDLIKPGQILLLP